MENVELPFWLDILKRFALVFAIQWPKKPPGLRWMGVGGISKLERTQ